MLLQRVLFDGMVLKKFMGGCPQRHSPKGRPLAKKTISFKAVLIMGGIVGISVIVIAYIAVYLQHKKTVIASIEGTLPKMEEKSGWQSLSPDQEGEHHYIVEKQTDRSGRTVSAWDRLTYSKEGRENYITKRRRNNMFVTGMDKLTHRYILYDFKCAEQPKRYAIMKVFEVAQDKKTLDYGKSGSQKDWEDVPEGTTIDRLAKVACPGQVK